MDRCRAGDGYMVTDGSVLATKKWIKDVVIEGPPPSARSFHAACVAADSCIYVIGGRDSDNKHLNDVHCLNFGRWRHCSSQFLPLLVGWFQQPIFLPQMSDVGRRSSRQSQCRVAAAIPSTRSPTLLSCSGDPAISIPRCNTARSFTMTRLYSV